MEFAGFIPVEEVAAIALEPPHSIEGIVQPSEKLGQVEISEIIGTEVGQNSQPDIGRRRTAGKNSNRLFLVIVRRQPVIIGAHEMLEEVPGAPREQAQVSLVALPELLVFKATRLIDVANQLWQQQPGDEKRSGGKQACWLRPN